MAYTSLLAADIDAKSPITDALMSQIKVDLDDLDSRLTSLGVAGGPFDWRLNGRLDFTVALAPASQGVPAQIFNRVDDIFLAKGFVYTQHKIYLGTPGTSGTLEADIRKYRALNIPIQSVTRLFNDTITSISEITATNTQSITRATAQVNTQSITYFKSSINIASIVFESDVSEMRVNLSAVIDAEAAVGDSYVVSGASAGGNNGTFTILRIGDDGLNNVVLSNASAVDQSTATGTIQLAAFKYNLAGSASAHFVAGENVLMAGHTSGVNDGTLLIYAVNSGGNNIVVKHSTGAAQGGAAGTIDCLRLSFNFTGAAGTEFVAGESAVCAGHSSGNNNGTFVIRAVNSGGNNLILSNTVITLQGGAAGSIKSLRKLVNLNLDPTGLVAIGETVVISGSVSFDGTYAAKEINRGAVNNIVFYNINAGTGAGVGSFYSGRVKVTFSASHASDITTSSKVEISGCAASGNNGSWPVLAVNYSAGTNILIDNALNSSQASPMGRVDIESKSLFTVRPTIVFSNNGYKMQSSSNGTLGTEATVITGDMLGVEILSIPSGNASDVYVQLF